MQEATIRLTQQVAAGGCASKLPPGTLREVLDGLSGEPDENLLVGFETSDDAGVYRLSPDQALVQTVDFFTPVVDDPFTYGQIAAANALSDVYAMGGIPRTALTLVCFPLQMDTAVLREIIRGGLSIMQQAGCTVVGGHSVRDQEIKFGYAVTGLIHPDRVYRNTGARPGDALILGKAIGTGVILTALKQGKAQPAWVAAATASMTQLNKDAATVALQHSGGLHGLTDVTGFGLMGHARELALGSGVRLEIEAAAVPLLDGALDAVRANAVPAGLHSNREFASCIVKGAPGVAPELETLLYDPQTSGGLLMSITQDAAAEVVKALRQAGYAAAVIGRVLDGEPGIVLR
jgi:selenide,water dikinase